MNNNQQQILEVYLQEYGKLKEEQMQRIGFRDNLLYVTLAVFSGVIALAFGERNNPHALLVLPWVGLVLGWTYLVNDQKISAIGRYIRCKLVDNIRNTIDRPDADSVFSWEIEHKSDRLRVQRKIVQLIIDEIAFVFSGITGLLVFSFLVSQPEQYIQILWWIELLLLVALGVKIFIYADLRKEK